GAQHSTKVILSSAEHITYQNNKDLDVDIHLQVEYLPLEEGAQREQKDIYIRVPITLGSDENFAVTSLPSFIPQTNAASKVTAVDTYKGIQVDNAEVQKIKETLNSFLTVYFGGTANEISYYLTNDSEISKVASGMVEYQNLGYATVCQEVGTN
ncbi:MAG: conjugal transfer protein, partial [Aminipila sp.]